MLNPLMTKLGAAMASTSLMTCLALAGARGEADGPQVPPPPAPVEGPNAPQDPGDDGVEAQARGPIHEAFAAPVVFDPRPGFVVPKEPPRPLEEVPPDQRPQGKNIQWVSGYWAWDDDRTDFLWVSGFWRDLPPGRQWVPGYWSAAQGGWQWTSGYWAPEQGGDVEYLPQPPATVDNGPNVPQPSADSTWVPGLWAWQQQRYIWRPGYWITPPPQWVWVPSYYAWTPCGYVYVQGYWDYPIVDRGMLFAPAYVSPVVIARPSFVFVPTVTLVTTALTQAFFCRPTYCHYYFGDYFATSYVGSGFVPFGGVTNVNVTNINITNINVNRGPRVYDPIFVHERMVQRGRDPRWEQRTRELYRQRVNDPATRPARTFAEAQRAAGPGRPAQVQTLAAVARDPAASSRLEKVDQARRAELAKQANEHRVLQERRAKAETAARLPEADTKGRPTPKVAPDRPKFDLPKSARVENQAKGVERAKGAMEAVKKSAGAADLPKRTTSAPGPQTRPFEKAKGAMEAVKKSAGPTEPSKSSLVGDPQTKRMEGPTGPIGQPKKTDASKVPQGPAQLKGTTSPGPGPQPALRKGMEQPPATKAAPKDLGPRNVGPRMNEPPPRITQPRIEPPPRPPQGPMRPESLPKSGQPRSEARPVPPPARPPESRPQPPPHQEKRSEQHKKGNSG